MPFVTIKALLCKQGAAIALELKRLPGAWENSAVGHLSLLHFTLIPCPKGSLGAKPERKHQPASPDPFVAHDGWSNFAFVSNAQNDTIR